MDKNYDTRKQESEKISLSYLNDFLSFQQNERKHDISDAMLMIIYYFNNLPKLNNVALKISKISNCLNPFNLFDKFRYKEQTYKEQTYTKSKLFEDFRFKEHNELIHRVTV